MIKKTILTSLAFIFLLTIFMIVNMPANWVYKQFIAQKISEYPVKVQTPQETIWAGSTALSTLPNIPITAYIPNLRWSFQYQQLASLKLLYQINFNSIEAVGKKLGSYTAYVGVDLNGYILQIEDNNALLSINAKMHLNNKSRVLKGNVKLRKNDPDLKNLLLTIPQIKSNGDFEIPINF
jgi:hypothetical protein